MAQLHRSFATLRIFGDALDPDEISNLVGSLPNLSYRKGQLLNSKNHDIVRRTGGWHLNATTCEPGNLDAQVEEILVKTTRDLTVWARLNRDYKIDLFCGLFMEETDEGVELSAKTLLALGERGIKIGLCLYAPTENAEAKD